jgi:UDP-N-acetylmuramoylalanine--D-glutamate ligase
MKKETAAVSFRGKRVTVMGLGLNGGGIAAVHFLLREKAKKIIVTDLHTKKRLAPAIAKIPRRASVVYHLGGHRSEDFTNVDYIIKNPDVPWSSPYIRVARRAGVPVLSDVIIFFQRVRRPIVGITGTKGKSTTTALIALALQAGGKRVAYGGNVRWRSPLEIIDLVRHTDYVVLELSSFQLEDLETVRMSPHIAVITSIAPDHLNRHGTYAEYKRVKLLITKFQTSEDVLVIPADREIRAMTRTTKAQVYLARASKRERRAIRSSNEYLSGHMTDAAYLALLVAKRLGISRKKVLQKFSRFRALEGRRQFVRMVRGVQFINDTTATVPTAAAADLRYFAGQGRVILIAGGMDKKVPMRVFSRAIAGYPKEIVLLPGTATDRIIRELPRRARERLILAESMPEAVKNAFALSKKGDTVLLAPGATSFNLFFNEFHRGEEFVRAVKALS